MSFAIGAAVYLALLAVVAAVSTKYTPVVGIGGLLLLLAVLL